MTTTIRLDHNLEAAALHIKVLNKGQGTGWDTPMQFQIITDDKRHSNTWKRRANGTPIDPMARVYYGTLRKLQRVLIEANNLGGAIFITVNVCEGEKRNIASVTKVRAVFIDADYDKFSGKLRLEPSFRVRRGDNFHAYWLVDDMPLEQFSNTQLGIAAVHGTDHVTDLSRVLRLAGFFHQKNFHGQGVPAMCHLEDVTGRVYSTEEIHEAYPMYVKEVPRRIIDLTQPCHTGRTVSAVDSLTLQEIIERAKNAKNGAKFERLLNGDITGYASQSEGDLAFMHLCFYWFTPENADEVFRSSALMRDKWDTKHGSNGETYGQLTFNKAMSRFDGKTFQLNEPRVGGKLLGTLECALRYGKNLDKVLRQGLKVIKAIAHHSSTAEGYGRTWGHLIEQMRNPQSFTRNDEGELIMRVGGLQKAELLGVGKMQSVSQRLRSLAQNGFIARVGNIDPSNKKSELVVVLPENFEQLGIFSLTLEESKSGQLARIKRYESPLGNMGAIGTTLPCDAKAYCPHIGKVRLEREKFPLRRATPLAMLLREGGAQTLEQLSEVATYGEKGLKNALKSLVESGAATLAGDHYTLNWAIFRDAKTSESENSESYRNGAFNMARESVSHYARVGHLIVKYNHTSERSLARLADARKKEAFHRERIERLKDGEPVWSVFGLDGEPARTYAEQVATAA